MSLRLLIVDDEALARGRLRSLLSDCTAPAACVVAEASNVVDAMHCVTHQTIDAVLADIHMPGANGLTLAHHLRALPSAPALVFVTAHTEHAVDAFELEAVDYLTKPVRLERLQSALQKIERVIKDKLKAEGGLPSDVIVIQERGRTERVPLWQVLYLKAELKYITVRTAAHTYILEGALGELEHRFSDHFLRIHRNALVARRAIRALEKHHDPQEGEGWAVRLDGVPEPLLVSRRQLAVVRDVVAGVSARGEP